MRDRYDYHECNQLKGWEIGKSFDVAPKTIYKLIWISLPIEIQDKLLAVQINCLS